MLTETILRYLESNRRLVIPQLGAFVVKEPGVSILFSELLRRDDGVLRSLLCNEGMTELEAAGAIDRFVFEVRHALQEGERRYPMAGFGVLSAASDGTIHFDYAPRTVGPAEADPAARSKARLHTQPKRNDEDAASRSTVSSGMEHRTRTITHDQPVAVPFQEDKISGRHSESDAAAAGHSVVEETPAAEAEEWQESSAKAPRNRRDDTLRGPRDGQSRPAVSKMRPDPSVKGLRYGKPIKTTDAYTYVGAAPRRRFDRLIIVAIAAAVIALAAITYGYIRGRQAARADAWSEETMLPADTGWEETPASEPEPSEETQIQNP